MKSLNNKFKNIADKALKQKAKTINLDMSICSICKKKVAPTDTIIKQTGKSFDEIFESMINTFDIYGNVDLNSEIGKAMKQFIINEYNKNVIPVCVCKKCNQNTILNNKQQNQQQTQQKMIPKRRF